MRTLKPLNQEHPLPPGEMADALTEARKACINLDLSALIGEIEQEIQGNDQRLMRLIESRREDLLKAARQHDFPHKRFTDYDHVGPFKLSYKDRSIHLELGSERFASIQELNGTRLFELVREKAIALDLETFSRDSFFQCLKDALRTAKSMGRDQEGRVPIRILYPFLVLARQSRSEEFLSKPDSRTFKDYPLYQFLYDLARFGRDGWRCGDELLRTQTPNMATISQGKTLMLPTLDAQEGASQRIAVLWIEKREG